MTLKEWIKAQLDKTISVQTTLLNTSYADLVVLCWSGVRIHIYMIGDVVSPRAIKRTLQDNTESGINTIFLVDARLIPPDGERAIIKEWLIALQKLNHDKVYAYHVKANTPQVFEVHFEDIFGAEEKKIWYGPQIDFNRLRSYRTYQTQRTLKGNWLIADFGAQAFWKNTEYRTYQQQKDEARRRHNQTRWESWSGYQTWGGMNDHNEREAKPNSPIQDYLLTCYKLLEINHDANEEAVKKAYRQKAKLLHPDTSDLPKDEAHTLFQALKAAYEYIRAANGWD
ncbi:MAG: hypothetical protein Kow00117_10140 [Phototrophicales bacterium]